MVVTIYAKKIVSFLSSLIYTICKKKYELIKVTNYR